MKLPHRRQFLHLAAGAAALPAVSSIARAQVYPSRPVRLLVGFAAGGPADIVARLMAQWLSERLGQQVVVENRVGGASNIAAEAVVRSSPDGYTLLQVTISNAINATLYDKLTFDLTRDIVPVASIMRSPGVMEVNPSAPAFPVDAHREIGAQRALPTDGISARYVGRRQRTRPARRLPGTGRSPAGGVQPCDQ